MKTILLAALLFAAADTVYGQRCTTSPSDLQLEVAPTVAQLGETVQVALTNTSTTCTYFYQTTCLFEAVHSGDCDGDEFFLDGCSPGPTALGPGETAVMDWDQTIGQGVQVPAGQYALPIALLAETGLLVELCPTVQVGTACSDPVSYGTGTPGTGGFVPSISTVGGPPALGSASFGAAVTGGLGGATSLVLVSLDSASLGPFLVDPTQIVITSLLPLSDGGPGQGIGILSLPVPPNAALLGLEIFFQGIVADGGGIGGLAFTDAVRTAICQ